jgi:hypothetical protein
MWRTEGGRGTRTWWLGTTVAPTRLGHVMECLPRPCMSLLGDRMTMGLFWEIVGVHPCDGFSCTDISDDRHDV